MAYPHPRRALRLAMLGLFVATSVVTAQGPVSGRPFQRQPATPTPERLSPIQEGRGAFESPRRWQNSATVLGMVQNEAGALVPRAGMVIVRNLLDGTVSGQSEVDALAQFTVRTAGSGTFMAELVSPVGSVLTTSTSFSAGVGEVIQIVPIIPSSPASGLLSAVGSATSSVLTSAASAGIIAVNPGQPVSPQ